MTLTFLSPTNIWLENDTTTIVSSANICFFINRTTAVENFHCYKLLITKKATRTLVASQIIKDSLHFPLQCFVSNERQEGNPSGTFIYY